VAVGAFNPRRGIKASWFISNALSRSGKEGRIVVDLVEGSCLRSRCSQIVFERIARDVVVRGLSGCQEQGILLNDHVFKDPMFLTTADKLSELEAGLMCRQRNITKRGVTRLNSSRG